MQEYCFLHVGTFSDASKWILLWSDKCTNSKNNVLSIFSYVGTFSDASNQILFWSDQWSDCKSTVFCMLVHSLMFQNEFCYEVINALISVLSYVGTSMMHQTQFWYEVINALIIIATVLFSAHSDILWYIKTNFVMKWLMH